MVKFLDSLIVTLVGATVIVWGILASVDILDCTKQMGMRSDNRLPWLTCTRDYLQSFHEHFEKHIHDLTAK